MRDTRQKSQTTMTLIDHIRELRVRLLVSALILVIAGVGVYFLYEPILALLRSPLGTPLYYSSPAGSFAFVMKICFMGALAITIPIIVYNLIMFIRPAFVAAIPKRRVYMTSLASGVLAAAGATFGFLVIIPGALHFFAGFQVDGLSALISADSYLSFVTNVIITFILVFQLPLVLTFIDRIKPLTPKSLFKAEKWVILGSLIISFLVPFALDITTSILIALPIIVLYNLSIVAILMHHARVATRQRKMERVMLEKGLAAMPNSSLALSEVTFESLVGSSFIEPTSHSVMLSEQTIVAQHVRRNRSGVMDIRPSRGPAPVVTPAPWVHRIHDPIPLSERAKIISDIRPVSNGRVAA